MKTLRNSVRIRDSVFSSSVAVGINPLVARRYELATPVISVQNRSLPALGLASCMIGLIISPYAYVALGALGHFAPAFGLVTVPLLLLASGFLIWACLSKPAQDTTDGALLVIEGVSWAAVVAFLVLISGFGLFTTFERIGLFCTVFLLASAGSFPLLLMRNTALEQRLRKWPRGVSMAVLLLIAALSGFAMGAYQLSDPQFM